MDEAITGKDIKNLRGNILKKILAILMILIVIFISFWYIFNNDGKIIDIKSDLTNEELILDDEPPTPPGSDRGIDAGRHVLEITDESPHRYSRREWWYFNVFFNDPKSDLKNWSMIVAFNKMARLDIRFQSRDSLFMMLYDSDEYHKFSSLGKKRGTFKSIGPGVNLVFENSWAKGQYPNWFLHAENPEMDFIAELEFDADFLPVWVEGRSSNLPFSGFLAGNYYIPRCKVEGEIIWEGKTYSVRGVGYHDHVWENNIPRFISKGWDWFNLHFENGWEMYISKFNLRSIRDNYAGAIIISPNNRDMVEFVKFDLKVLESVNPADLPSLSYPKKLRLEANRDDMDLVLDINIYNTCETVWKRARIGMFEGPCTATGTFSWSGNNVELNGYGFSEFTKVKYLLQRPNIINFKN